MEVLELASFSDGATGGNPAGVVLLDVFPSASEMQACAAAVGFSETAFASPENAARTRWRVRYFSPETEVPFCGHATIALGAVLAETVSPGVFDLILNDTRITVEGTREGPLFSAALQSPPTGHDVLSSADVLSTLDLFDYGANQLDPEIAPARINAGADHYLLLLKDRQALSVMTYDLDWGRAFMTERGIVTIMLAVRRGTGAFDARNAFASGGVVEDPATGAAAAAFAGYLRDTGLQEAGVIDLTQGEDMGMTSKIRAESTPSVGSSIRVSGTVRIL